MDAGDWASGTSAWSSKLVHGGLRYLLNLDFKLVAEALKERGLLLTSLAPHLVKPVPLMIPLYSHNQRSKLAVRAGMVARTPRGRVATAAAWHHLGLTPPAGALNASFGVRPRDMETGSLFDDL